MDKPEHLGPMARSLVETFAGLTLAQQRRVFTMLREVMETNEQLAAQGQEPTVSDVRPGGDAFGGA